MQRTILCCAWQSRSSAWTHHCELTGAVPMQESRHGPWTGLQVQGSCSIHIRARHQGHLGHQALCAHAVRPHKLGGVAVCRHGCCKGAGPLGGKHVQQAFRQQVAQVAGPCQLASGCGSFCGRRLLLLVGSLYSLCSPVSAR